MVKVDVVSGFLGAGKTTLIMRLLKTYADEKVVLIENEFGEVGIDGDFVEREGFDVLEVTSGCICCKMKKDFEIVLNRILKEYSPDRLIIEPTGISILSEIIDVLSQPEYKAQCEINTIITVVDSLNYLSQRDNFGEFFEDQIANASLLVLSKSQLVELPVIADVVTSLREWNASAPVIDSDWHTFSHEDVRNLTKGHLHRGFEEILYSAYKPCGENKFTTFAMETSKKFTREWINEALSELHHEKYGQVVRGKGFLNGTGHQHFHFSYTNGYYTLQEHTEKLQGKLCLIGKDLNKEALKRLFEANAEDA